MASGVKVTRVAYSLRLNIGKYAQLAEQAGRLGRVRSLVWDRCGSISGVGVSDRQVRDAWMADGTCEQFGVLANAWKETVRDAVADIRAHREAAKVTVRHDIHRTIADESERKRLYTLLKRDQIDDQALKSSHRPCGVRQVGVDKGYSEVLTDSDGVRHGRALGSLLQQRSDQLRARNARRAKLRSRVVWQADHAAAINILDRDADPDIGLRTPHTRVRQIIQERADRHRSRLPDQDSNTADHCRCGERNIPTSDQH